ncbi:aminotransferase class I/II-fold pyridoxal phosphate-dependent enzyme [Sphingopyxis sp. DBS4]|uniref:aminotransferase class I/II-fold pyridoxal phosphate-dependent enzyme n=1 Tax=Sphingopyxis sp. DBS4 TaxID=2968500 RepID=UPI00214CEAF0|nr:aminotransferase class I/II-fold pyridoxal phosphate-dependent enzyme [Sphingopyxis sp. DBS4]
MTPDWTWHGGALEAAKRHFGTGDAPWLDLSTGINPHPWPGADTIAIDWRRLPEREALADLEAAAAAHFGVKARHVCAIPGSEVGLRLAGRIIGGAARHVAPAYRTHGEIFSGSAPIDRAEAPTCKGTMLLANPNNPDGSIIDIAMLDAMLAQRDGWLLIDEAFADCAPVTSIAHRISDDRRLLVFRSFGKFFGLAGVRLGFVLGPPLFLDELRTLLGAWPVSAAALAIGNAAYRDRDWIAAMREQLTREAAALDALLTRRNLSVIGDCPLFRLVEADDAGALFERLARAAILTRPFADQPRWLRLGLPGSAAALARLDAALGG